MMRFVLIFSVLLFSSCEKGISYEQINLKKVDQSHFLPSDANRWVVYTFLSPECPLSENYTKVLNRLDSTYDQQADLYYVFSGTYYALDEIKAFYRRYGLEKDNVLLDPDYQLAHYFDASITPEAFLSDPVGKIYYRGAIDNWAITLGRQRQVVDKHYLKDAIDAVLSGNEVKIKESKAVGCLLE